MSSVILTFVEQAGPVLQTLAAARNLAELIGGARINVLAIRIPPEASIMPTEEVLTKHQATEIRTREEARIRALHNVFNTWAGSLGTPDIFAEWVDVEGLVDSVVGEWGRRSDFVVINRLEQQRRAPHRLALQAALFDTERPVLVVPPRPATRFGERVAIAWRDDKRTERAVLAVLRLLPQARQVHVLAGVRAGQPAPSMPKVLVEHDIDAELHVLPVGPGAFGEALLSRAHALGADLLVMGAYTHAVWRELILGGVTNHVLAHADLPVLMRH